MEEEDEEALGRVEDAEDVLEGQASVTYGEEADDPSQTCVAEEVYYRKRVDKRRMEKLNEEVEVREFQEEAGEELVKVGWTRGKNGRGTVDKESGCAQCGG